MTTRPRPNIYIELLQVAPPHKINDARRNSIIIFSSVDCRLTGPGFRKLGMCKLSFSFVHIKQSVNNFIAVLLHLLVKISSCS